MPIEEGFRDTKSEHYGLSLNTSTTQDVQRMQSLLLIGTLAVLVAWLVGKATELTGQHRRFQVNSLKDRVVLSTVFLGLQVIGDRQVRLSAADFRAAVYTLQQIIDRQLTV